MDEYAHSYADRGWPVLPLQPGGKAPLTMNGFKDATTDHKQISRWWAQWPGANIGIVTGQSSGLVIVDADCKHGSDGRLQVDRLGLTRDTFTVDTPSGGFHLYYRLTPGATIQRIIGIRPGLDILGEGGYAVAAASVVDGAAYLIANQSAIAECPPELTRLVQREPDVSERSAQVRQVSSGQRNSYLTRIAGRLRRQGLEQEELSDVLIATNARRCAPPLEEREVRRIAVSISRYEPTDPAQSTLQDWPEPGAIRSELTPVLPFVADALLPSGIRPWIMDEADRMPCPPDFVAAAAIVTLGSVVGTRCGIRPKANDDWVVVPNLWGGLVGLPAAKKSPAISAGMKPMDALIARAIESYQAQLPTYEAEKIGLEAGVSALEAKVKAAAKKGQHDEVQSMAKELAYVKTLAAEKPTLRRYHTNDATIEKLGELLQENLNGLLVQRDELVGLLASWDREGREGERAFFLEAWNGTGSFSTDRIGRGSIFVPHLALSVLGGIQPDKLAGYLEAASHALANDGMLQRFQVLVYPDHRPWEWRDCMLDKEARGRAVNVFEVLSDFDPVAWGASPPDDFSRFPFFRFGAEAQRVFIEWSAELHQRRIPRAGSPIVMQHLAKYDKLFPALALILHLVDCAATGKRGPISQAAAHAAAAWCEYLESHARRCYGLLMDGGFRAALALASRVRRQQLQDGFTARDIRRCQWRYLTTDQSVTAALDWLESEHWLHGQSFGGTGPGTGRRTIRYSINPKVLERARGGAADSDEGTPTSVTAGRADHESEDLDSDRDDRE